MIRYLLSSPGSRGSVSLVPRYDEILRTPPVLPAALRSPSLGGTTPASQLRFSRRTATRLRGPGVLSCRLPLPAGCGRGNERNSQVPGEPACTCPALRTPAGSETPGLPWRPNAAFRRSNHVGSRDLRAYGAPSHGPCTRCLRFATPIARAPRKTRFRLPARLCRAGLATRWVPTKGFSHLHDLLLSQASPGAMDLP